MKKVWKILIVVLILFIILNIYIYINGRKLYQDYYEKCLNIGGEGYTENTFGIADECNATQGCYFECGSACPPKQVNTILTIFTRKNVCTQQCVPQCVCKLGKRFAEDYGCV